MRLAAGCGESAMGSFRKVFTGGAPVFWHMLDAIAKAAPNARVFSVYGSTEAEPIAEVALDQLTREDRLATERGKGLPAGVPVPQVRLHIIADKWGVPIGPIGSAEFQRVTMRTGEIGEIVVAGQHVLRGYLDGRGDEETKFRVDGEVWHRTGDSGYLDERGRLWLTGRCQAKVLNGPGWVYPLQVEAAAHAMFDLRRAAFVESGSRRILMVEPGGGFDAEFESAVLARLDWARLDKVVVVDQIPVDRRHNAKIDYVAIARLARRV